MKKPVFWMETTAQRRTLSWIVFIVLGIFGIGTALQNYREYRMMDAAGSALSQACKDADKSPCFTPPKGDR